MQQLTTVYLKYVTQMTNLSTPPLLQMWEIALPTPLRIDAPDAGWLQFDVDAYGIQSAITALLPAVLCRSFSGRKWAGISFDVLTEDRCRSPPGTSRYAGAQRIAPGLSEPKLSRSSGAYGDCLSRGLAVVSLANDEANRDRIGRSVP